MEAAGLRYVNELMGTVLFSMSSCLSTMKVVEGAHNLNSAYVVLRRFYSSWYSAGERYAVQNRVFPETQMASGCTCTCCAPALAADSRTTDLPETSNRGLKQACCLRAPAASERRA